MWRGGNGARNKEQADLPFLHVMREWEMQEHHFSTYLQEKEKKIKFIVHLCDIGYLRTYFKNRKLFHLKHFHGFEINRARLVQFDVEKGVKNLISKAWASSQTFSLYSDRQ